MADHCGLCGVSPCPCDIYTWPFEDADVKPNPERFQPGTENESRGDTVAAEPTYLPGSVSIDTAAGASYLHVRPGVATARTVEIAPDVHVDVDSDGRIVGVEILRPTIDQGALVQVLQAARMPAPGLGNVPTTRTEPETPPSGTSGVSRSKDGGR